jgi:hypothetical protein
MIPLLGSLGFGFRFIIPKVLPSFVQHSFRFHGLIQDTHGLQLPTVGGLELHIHPASTSLKRSI